jgi:hypothetical protein
MCEQSCGYVLFRNGRWPRVSACARTGTCCIHRGCSKGSRRFIIVRSFERPDTASELAAWERKIGVPGAKLFVAHLWAYFLITPIALLTFISLAVAGATKNALLLDIGIAFVVVGIVTSIVLLGAPFGARIAASRALGIRISKRNSPPRDERAYLEWCKRNGVRAYSVESEGNES